MRKKNHIPRYDFPVENFFFPKVVCFFIAFLFVLNLKLCLSNDFIIFFSSQNYVWDCYLYDTPSSPYFYNLKKSKI